MIIGRRVIAAVAFASLLLAALVGFWLWQHPTNPTVPAGPVVPPAGGNTNTTTPAQGGGQDQTPGSGGGSPPAGSGNESGPSPGENETGEDGDHGGGGDHEGGDDGGGGHGHDCRADDEGAQPPMKWGLLAPWHKDHASANAQEHRMTANGHGHDKEHDGDDGDGECHGNPHGHAPPAFAGALGLVGLTGGIIGPRLAPGRRKE